MKKLILTLPLLLGLSGFLSAQSMSDETMQAWEEAMTPNENHEWLAQFEGNWTFTMTTWMDPKTEPSVTSGESMMQMVCQGRYLQEKHTGTSFGMPFEGHNTTAYDNITKKYITSWIDNMGTGIMVGEGEREGNTLTVHSSYPNLEGGEDHMKMVTTIVNENEHNMIMYMYDPDGNEMKFMELSYKKVR